MFKCVYIELSDYCGLSCSFCPSSKRQTLRGAMNLATFKQICSELKGLTSLIALHILGDPLGVKNLKDFLQIAKSYNLSVNLVTSGYFLQQEQFRFLADSPVRQVSFSLSAFCENKKLNKTHLQQILSFCLASSDIFINIRVQEWHLDNACMQEILKEIFATFGIQNDKENLDSLKKLKKIRLKEKTLLLITKPFQWEGDGKIKKQVCYGANKQIGILSNGQVVPCCIDYDGRQSFGNIKDSSLKQILESSEFKAFAASLKAGNPISKICQTCQYPQLHKINN